MNEESPQDGKSESPKEVKAERSKAKGKAISPTEPGSAIDNPHSAIKEQQTANSKLQTEKMEVHHHPEVEKKGLKEYILEGLMIFIAVMMGFFAESLREHISDGAKETKFIKGIVRNLHDDVKKLEALHKSNSMQIDGIDSMILLSEQDISKPANLRLFYIFMRKYLLANNLFSANDETLSQLRNSGGYLFIEKGNAADSIAKYDQLNNKLYNQGRYYDDGFTTVVNDAYEIADFKIL